MAHFAKNKTASAVVEDPDIMEVFVFDHDADGKLAVAMHVEDLFQRGRPRRPAPDVGRG